MGFKGDTLKTLTKNPVKTRFSEGDVDASLSAVGIVKFQGSSENLITSMNES